MFLDASAIIAILASEDDADALIGKIELAPAGICYSCISLFEAVIGLARKKSVAIYGDQSPTPADLIERTERIVLAFLDEIEAKPIPLDETVGSAAIAAAREFGRATGHEARLNFGDCFSYACARTQGLPLLYKGGDFSRTNIAQA
jgi:ribonuclease VapC